MFRYCYLCALHYLAVHLAEKVIAPKKFDVAFLVHENLETILTLIDRCDELKAHLLAVIALKNTDIHALLRCSAWVLRKLRYIFAGNGVTRETGSGDKKEIRTGNWGAVCNN